MPDPPEARILIIEDEKAMVAGLQFNLEARGYRVSAAYDGEQGCRKAIELHPDLVILDLMLPKRDGYEVCKRLKKDVPDIPIIMLTARSQEADVVLGFELGADDYVTKPFSPRVLMARVKAVLRRRQFEAERDEQGPGRIERPGLAIEPARHEVLADGQPVELTATEFRLLALLASRPGRVFTRHQIIDAIHGKLTAVTDRSVDVQVVMLRRKLGTHGADIQTVRGVGYRFKE